jgi:hypothetical protein
MRNENSTVTLGCSAVNIIYTSLGPQIKDGGKVAKRWAQLHTQYGRSRIIRETGVFVYVSSFYLRRRQQLRI